MLRALIVFVFFALIACGFAGCYSVVGPMPNSPEDIFVVTIDSIPSGALVYEANPMDGTLGRQLGKTPYELHVGLAKRRSINNSQPFFGPGGTNLWAPGNSIKWSELRSGNPRGYDLLLNVAVTKDGYLTSRITNKSVGIVCYDYWADCPQYPPRDTTVTVSLRPTVDTSTPKPQQQQQQQQQQTVIIPDTGSKEKGNVIVSSTPQNADVSVDGIFVGNSPCTLPLKEGIHIIEVKLSGYKPYRKELRVISGGEATIRVTLEQK